MKLAAFLMKLLLGKRLPQTEGTLRLDGIRSKLGIRRDRWGIPHIDADNELDAHFGQGFCHGQDRPFQLEILLRVVRGTLSEIIGPKAIPVDRLSRRIGFYRSAVETWPLLDHEMKEMLEAYSRGVNAGRGPGLTKLPHEFVLLRCKPSVWTALDCVALVKLMSFNLPSNWDIELARLKVLLADGPEALRSLDSAFDPEHLVTVPGGCKAGPAVDRLAKDLSLFQEIVGVANGSNNWVLAGKNCRKGNPILANDPHMEARLPAHWYLSHFRYPGGSGAGASFIGGPGIIVGHNEVAAWGLTAGLLDNSDLFREKISPDGTSVLQGKKWLPCTVLEEKINVRGKQSITEKVLITPRGPIVGPALAGEEEAISLRAIWLDPLPIRGLLFVYKSRNWNEFRAFLSDWPLLPANMVYADTKGNIGYQMAGTAPVRKAGHGVLPMPGWDERVGWEDQKVSFESMPTQFNPEVGYLASANTQPLPYDQTPFLGVDWIDGYRLARIMEMLKEKSGWDIRETEEMQVDQKAKAWEEMRNTVLGINTPNVESRQAIQILAEWNGVLDIESSAATVYELFLAEMTRRIAIAKAPNSYQTILGQGMSVLTPNNFWCFRRTSHLCSLLKEKPDGWFDGGWDNLIADVLGNVIINLKKRFGNSQEKWKWGNLRQLHLKHPLGMDGGLLGSIFNLGPVPYGGDTDTINQASALPLHPLASPANIASLRAVMDVGNWDECRFVLPGGQSGNPFSTHYSDLFDLWVKGEGVSIAWTEEAVSKVTVSTLDLTPE